MAEAFVFNNTAFTLGVLVIGAQTQAQFVLAPNSVSPLDLSPGLKALVAFRGSVLFALRPIKSTADDQVFKIDPNPGAVGGPVVKVFSAPDADGVEADISAVPQTSSVSEQPLIVPFGP